MIPNLFSTLVNYYMEHIGYGMVILLMTIESSFIPFPSEIVIPPAAWKAASGELSIVGVVLSGIVGSILGALINYGLAVSLGRSLIHKLAESRAAHLLMIDKKSIERVEEVFRKYGSISTFIGRLIPTVRQLISLPAGLARMDLRPFLFFTALGSGIWSVVLAVLGYYLYGQKELLEKYYQELSYGFLGVGVVCIVYLFWRSLGRRRKYPGSEHE
ncbi:MAG: DedA family protein [Spirochaetales bacterium]|nr:DedA family protein [Spirochaetales bacterium]